MKCLDDHKGEGGDGTSYVVSTGCCTRVHLCDEISVYVAGILLVDSCVPSTESVMVPGGVFAKSGGVDAFLAAWSLI